MEAELYGDIGAGLAEEHARDQGRWDLDIIRDAQVTRDLRQRLGGGGPIALHLDLVVQQGILDEYAVFRGEVDGLRQGEFVNRRSRARRLLSTEARNQKEQNHG